MDSGTSTIFGVATSDRVRRLYNAVISTGREALDVTRADRTIAYGWLPRNERLLAKLERLSAAGTDYVTIVRAARLAVREFFDGVW